MYNPHVPRYRRIEGKEAIEIRVNSVLQLFDSRDPAPFRERDLDDDFTDYIVACADEIPTRSPLRIQIYISQADPNIHVEAITQAVRSHFEYQVELKRIQFYKILRMARLFLFVGLCILSLCLVLAQWAKLLESDLFSTTLREGIVIFGWVSMWKPLELLLFDWYPIYDKIRLLKKIIEAEIFVDFETQRQPKAGPN
ncbi:MAG: hypothetical protein IPK04_06005 [Bdellovibrionales bacterium]|nr:hypothetical protein [Bdellovibrionales bacterium]